MSRIMTALSCIAAASFAVTTCAHAAKMVVLTADNDELFYYSDLSSWGPAICNANGAYFAPPRNSGQLATYSGYYSGSTIADGWAGIEYRPADGLDSLPNYYVVDGRFKDCLHSGYPFGGGSSYWTSGVIPQQVGQVKWTSGKFETLNTTTTYATHCVTYMCNNNDDCVGNGLSATGTWPACSCGGCVANVSGDSCNMFTIGETDYYVNTSLTYGTPDTMRAMCEASGRTLFSTTANQAEWDLLQTYIPNTYRFFVDINDNDTEHSWKNSNGDNVSNSSTFNSPFFGVWSSGEGNDERGGHCVEMDEGELYQSSCTGNRYFICVTAYPTTTTTAVPTNATTTTTTTTSATTTADTTTSTTTTSNTTTTLSNNTNITNPLGSSGVAASVSTVAAIVVMVICAALF